MITREYDDNWYLNHIRFNDGDEVWFENDKKGNVLYIKDSRGYEVRLDKNGRKIEE